MPRTPRCGSCGRAGTAWLAGVFPARGGHFPGQASAGDAQVRLSRCWPVFFQRSLVTSLLFPPAQRSGWHLRAPSS